MKKQGWLKRLTQIFNGSGLSECLPPSNRSTRRKAAKRHSAQRVRS